MAGRCVRARSEAPELLQTVKDVERFTKDKSEMSAKASLVNELRKKQATLVRLVDAMPDWTLDGQIWFIKMEVKDDKASKLVTLEGGAKSNLAFARFYTQLENQPLVKKLALEISQSGPTVERAQPVTKFKLSFTLEEYR
jgi:hypothetical protein